MIDAAVGWGPASENLQGKKAAFAATHKIPALRAAFSCAKAEIGTGSKAAATKADAVDFSADTVRDPVHQLAATNE
jgi:hypothetical protein